MLDTIKLQCRGLSVESNAPISIVPATIDLATGEVKNEAPLFYTDSGEVVTGGKAYYNSENVNVDFTGRGAFVRFSLPKVYHNGNNAFPVGIGGAEAVFNAVNEHLESVGIHTDLRQGYLSRVDIFGNLFTDYSFETYSRLFDLLSAKRMRKVDYGTTYNYSNTQRELDVYDKVNELNSRGIDTSDLPKNVMRIEYRMLKARKCKNDLAVETAFDLLKRWSDLPDIYKAKVKEVLFTIGAVEDVRDLVCSVELERMRWFNENAGSYWWSKYRQYSGDKTIIELFGSEDKLRSAMLQFKDKSTVSKCIKQLRDNVLRSAQVVAEDVSMAELYNELYGKVMAL